MNAEDALDNPVFAALNGPHERFARRRGRVVRYPDDIAAFMGLPSDASPSDWADARALLVGNPGAVVARDVATLPSDLAVVRQFPVIQMIDSEQVRGASPRDLEGFRRLGPADADDMLDLARRTEPGPFNDRTAELGAFFGVRREGRLVAMAGERLRLPGWTELSAVCTDPVARGQGLASQLVAAVAGHARDEGQRLFLHVMTHNAAATRLYRAMGFVERARVVIVVLSVP